MGNEDTYEIGYLDQWILMGRILLDLDTYEVGYLDQWILMGRNTYGLGYLWEIRILMRLDT